MIDRDDLLRRFRGMFWGLVVGDCLGSPIQFSDKDHRLSPRFYPLLNNCGCRLWIRRICQALSCSESQWQANCGWWRSSTSQ